MLPVAVTARRICCSVSQYKYVRAVLADIHNKPVIMKSTTLTIGLLAALALVGGAFLLTGCGSKNVKTPAEADEIPNFHQFYFENQQAALTPNQLALYVDYSNCIAQGQHSAFFQAFEPSLTASAKQYFAIKGKNIEPHSVDSTYSLLRTIDNVSFADLKTAAERIANGNTEGVLLTDGEYYERSVAKGNDNNPYLAKAFKTWLKKGHDIFIFAEPYEEMVNNRAVQKKRFYFLFTDQRLPDNIYDRVKQSVRLEDFPGTSEFHFSVRAPFLYSPNGKGMQPSELLSAEVLKATGYYEVQEWKAAWKKTVEHKLQKAKDKDGKVRDGKPFESGIHFDRNILGGYRIDRLTAKVYNVNQEYSKFCSAKDKEKLGKEINLIECEDFVKVNDKQLAAKDSVELTFAGKKFKPKKVLNGTPFNYTKIDLFATDISPMTNVYLPLFTFESLTHPGEQNVSVGASIQQCLIDPEIKELILKTPIYTLYIKSNKR